MIFESVEILSEIDDKYFKIQEKSRFVNYLSHGDRLLFGSTLTAVTSHIQLRGLKSTTPVITSHRGVRHYLELAPA
jgi:hypothetical protein